MIFATLGGGVLVFFEGFLIFVCVFWAAFGCFWDHFLPYEQATFLRPCFIFCLYFEGTYFCSL